MGDTPPQDSPFTVASTDPFAQAGATHPCRSDAYYAGVGGPGSGGRGESPRLPGLRRGGGERDAGPALPSDSTISDNAEFGVWVADCGCTGNVGEGNCTTGNGLGDLLECSEGLWSEVSPVCD